MGELILYAIPAFVLLLVVELLSFKYARDEDLVGYESRDTRTSHSSLKMLTPTEFEVNINR